MPFILYYKYIYLFPHFADGKGSNGKRARPGKRTASRHTLVGILLGKHRLPSSPAGGSFGHIDNRLYVRFLPNYLRFYHTPTKFYCKLNMLEIYFRVTPCHPIAIVPEIEWNRWRRTTTLLAHGSDTSILTTLSSGRSIKL